MTRALPAPVALLALALAAVPARGADAPAAAAPLPAPAVVTEVRVERVRPPRTRHATLDFLKENRDFIRGRFDLLRQRPLGREEQGIAVDPRDLEYRRLLAEAGAAREALAHADDERRRHTLLASVTELGAIEARLDLTERLLAAQRERLAVLQADFTGRQRTALLVLVSGAPPGDEPLDLRLALEDGTDAVVPLTRAHGLSLREGGMVQVFHGFVEPREQVLEVTLGGEAPSFVRLEPARDRLTFLRLDLAVSPDRGGTALRASTWLLDS